MTAIKKSELPAYPHSFLSNHTDHFILGVTKAKKKKEIVNGKPWPIVRRIVRWHRISISNTLSDSQKGTRIHKFMEDSIESILKEKTKGKLKSVVAIVYAQETNEPTIMREFD